MCCDDTEHGTICGEFQARSVTFNNGRTDVILRLSMLKMLICHPAVLVYLGWYLNNSAQLCEHGGLSYKEKTARSHN